MHTDRAYGFTYHKRVRFGVRKTNHDSRSAWFVCIFLTVSITRWACLYMNVYLIAYFYAVCIGARRKFIPFIWLEIVTFCWINSQYWIALKRFWLWNRDIIICIFFTWFLYIAIPYKWSVFLSFLDLSLQFH